MEKNNETYKYYIDFALAHGIGYVILDEGWSVNLKADLMQVIPEIDLKGLVEYGKSKNVDIILWAGYWLYDSGKNDGFKALVYMHRYTEDTTGIVVLIICIKCKKFI
jgi:hypothetical protein